MTGHKALSAGGRPLSTRIAASLPELVAHILSSLLAEVPLYGRLPAEELHGEVASIIEHNVRVFGDLLREQRLATVSELDRQRMSARRRAEEGVPLDAVLEAYLLGTSVLWQDITIDATAADFADLQAGQRLLLGYLRQLTAAVSAEYMEARQSLLHAEHDARRSLITALLAGGALDNPAQYAGLPLPDQYAVLVVSAAPHTDEADEAIAGPVAGRRKIRRIQSLFEQFTEEPVLSVLDANGGVVLIPSAPGDTLEWGKLRTLVQQATATAGADVIAAGVIANPAGVPDAVKQAGEILALVRRLGYDPGLYRLTDVLLEYQLSRPSPARAELARLLDPLRANPDLLRTLQAYLRNGLSRTRTATELFVHPNTVDYRLRRITQLTGLNPALPQDLQHLRAAMLAGF
ncbi:transcriptional regulator [Rhizocola hellebori]|uniref:Transcriptional regulator n=1 Tax=Rhizocola hellebori TaxID=1392758 RepID=A0A8J3VCX4_9ACTN|nr:helix-turn-helix domain-containing protein [Rhizocola hellebori]GIH02007.1 transcriptional regulator [Rhizocola hellebori]